jgi:hypothetical protein
MRMNLGQQFTPLFAYELRMAQFDIRFEAASHYGRASDKSSLETDEILLFMCERVMTKGKWDASRNLDKLSRIL